MRYLAASLALAVVVSTASAQEVTLKKIKYDELTKVINSHKGKVVVVDFWATY
jgi:hypothetical protein